MQNRQLIFSPRKPYDLVAESANSADKLREATASRFQFPLSWSFLEIVRPHFAAAGGEESPPQNSEIAAPPRR